MSTRRLGNKRGAVLIFVVIIVTALAAILLSTADLSRIAEIRQHAMERQAIRRYMEDSARTMVLTKIAAGDTLPYDYSLTINGSSLRVQAEEELGWMGQRSVRISWETKIDGYTVSSIIHTGKRAPPPPVYFGLWVEGILDQTGGLNVTQDGGIYLAGTVAATGINVDGDAFTNGTSMSSDINVSGATYLGQPSLAVTLDATKYDTAKNKNYNGNQTLTGTTILSSTPTNPLIYVNGNLTLSGNYSKSFTAYIKGNLTLNTLRKVGDSRAVLIVDGNASITGINDVVIICNGLVEAGAGAGKRVINGSVIAKDFTINTYAWDINWDSYFYDTVGAAALWKIPGSW